MGAANLNLVNCAAEDLPFIDQSFDVVLHVGGINFFSDKKRAIEEMIRVAKPSTKIMIADENFRLHRFAVQKEPFHPQSL